MLSRTIKNRFSVTILFLIAVFVFGALLLSNQTSKAFDNDVALLKREQTEEDHLPNELANSITSLDTDTIRLIANQNDRSYWVANNTSGDLCVVSAMGLGTDDWIAGVGCNNYQQFIRHGIGITLIDEAQGTYLSGVFIPDGYGRNLQSLFEAEVLISNNFIVFDDADSLRDHITNHSLVVEPDSNEARQRRIEIIFP